MLLKTQLCAVKPWSLVFSVFKIAHVRLLHPSHGFILGEGGKHNPKPPIL